MGSSRHVRIRTIGLGVLTVVAALLAVTALPAAPVMAAPAEGVVTLNTCVDAVDTWSIDARLEQLLIVSGDFSNLAASQPEAANGVGAFVFFGQPAAGSGPAIQTGIAGLVAAATGAKQVVPWMSTDEEGGTVARLSNVIGSLPTARQMAAMWTTAQVQAALATHGAAMRSLGMTMDLAPVLDTASPTNPIADENDRSFSEKGQVAAAYGLAFAQGLQSSAIVSVVKHFPGLGHASANTDLQPATDPPLSQLQTDDLIPFQSAITAGLPVVMVSHASVPGLTGTVAASLSSATYQFMRNSLQFNGVAMTDALWAGAISQAGYSVPAATLAALKAGADMAMIQASDWQNTLRTLEQAVSNGTLSLAALNASVTRILAAKGVHPCTTGVSVAVTGNATASVFWSGATRNLYQALGSANGALKGPNALGIGPLGSTPAAGVDANGATYVYWTGTDNNLWEAFWNGSQWMGPFNRGMGPLASPPAIAISPSGFAYVFWEGTDGNLWEAMGSANGALSGPRRIGMGPLGSPPTASVDRTGATYVYWKGTDSNLWEGYWNGSAWVGPFNRGMGPLGSTPSLAMTPGAMSYVFWEGTNRNLWEAQGPAKQALSGPFNRGMGALDSAPTAGLDASGATYVYWIGTDDNLWEGYWGGTRWVGPYNRGLGPLR
jgi:beta-N-acetylhexosaminidase